MKGFGKLTLHLRCLIALPFKAAVMNRCNRRSSRSLSCSEGNRRSRSTIIASLAWDSITDSPDEIDYRDQIIEFAIIYHSCTLAELDPKQIFHKVMASSKEKTSKRLAEFINRNEKDKSLKAFDLHISINNNGEKVLTSPFIVQ